MPHIHSASYGESRLRMLRVSGRGDRHVPRDVTIALRFEGRFDDAFRGDGARLVPGEAVKNLVHRIARDERHDTIEDLGLALAHAILHEHASIGLARIEISEQPWARLEPGGKPHGRAFTPAGVERRTAAVTSNGSRVSISSGFENLVLMRSAESAGAGPEQSRLLVASLSARWGYGSGEIAFAPYRQGVHAAIVQTFVWHDGALQQTLHEIAGVIMATYQEVMTVTLSLQQFPYRPSDLLELAVNGDALFVAHNEPLGVIEITVERGQP